MTRDRRTSLDVSHDSASGRARLRDVGEGLLDVQRRRQQLGRAWRSTRRAGSSSCRPDPPRPISTAANRVGDNLLRELAARARRGDRATHLALPDRAPRIWDRDLPSPPSLVTVRQNGRDDRRGGADDQAWFVFVFDRQRAPLFPIEYRKVPRQRRPGRDRGRHPALPDHRTLRAATADRRHAHDANAGGPRGRVDEVQRPQTARSFRSRRQGHRDLSGIRRRCRMGGSAIDPETGMLLVNANDIAWIGGLATAWRQPGQNAQALYLKHCASCHGDNITQGTPRADSPDSPERSAIAARSSR